MRKIHSSLLRFVSVLLLFSSLAGNAHAAAPQARWTVMVYISGDNDLEPYVINDIQKELGFTGSNENVQVVALADRGPGISTGPSDWKQTLLFHVTPGMTAIPENAVANWGERDMANPQTLIDFVTWTKTNYPADHYALYFWGHGWNWRPGFVMRDDTSKDTMDYHEQKAAIPSLGFIDMVGYDGCNMASIEVFDLWHGHATAVTSSQEFVFSEGVQYDAVLTELIAHPDMSADQLAITTSETATSDRTWSAVAVDGRLDDLISAVDAWSLALNEGLEAHRKKYDRAFGAARSFWKDTTDKDLYDLAYEIDRLVSDPDINTTSEAVMSAVDAVVLDERHVNSYRDVHGITIYQISRAREKDESYMYYTKRVDFALQTGWDEFLEAYANK